MFVCFFCFLQEVQTEPVLNALRDPRKSGRRCKTQKDSLPSAHLQIKTPQEFSKSKSTSIPIQLKLHEKPLPVNLALLQTQGYYLVTADFASSS